MRFVRLSGVKHQNFYRQRIRSVAGESCLSIHIEMGKPSILVQRSSALAWRTQRTCHEVRCANGGGIVADGSPEVLKKCFQKLLYLLALMADASNITA